MGEVALVALGAIVMATIMASGYIFIMLLLVASGATLLSLLAQRLMGMFDEGTTQQSLLPPSVSDMSNVINLELVETEPLSSIDKEVEVILPTARLG